VPTRIRRELEEQRGPVPFLGRMSSLLEIARQVSPASKENEVLQNEFYRGLALLQCVISRRSRESAGDTRIRTPSR
jgi:hypothetical protein